MPEPKVPLAPKGPAPTQTPSVAGVNTSAGTSSGGGSGSKDAVSGYEKRQNAKEAEAKRKAAAKYLEQAATLNQQAKALKLVLNGGFMQALDTRLNNLLGATGLQQGVLMEGYRKRVGSLAGAEADNTKAADASGYANQANRGRERANAMSEATLQGAGESDLLRAQQASLRNWSANQGEITRGFYDTTRSINSSLTDLNVDTKTARINLATQSNADRAQLWNDYFGQMSEAYTQLGNIRGQQAELYGLANEAVGSKDTKRKQHHAAVGMGHAFTNSAQILSQSYEDPGVPKALKQWQGHDQFDTELGSSKYVNKATDIAPARPEGATLRNWS